MSHLTYGSELPVTPFLHRAFVYWFRHLKDCTDKIAAVTDAQIGLLSDVSTILQCGAQRWAVFITLQLRELFQARIALEKDYAVKLQTLVKKANEKKSKRLPKAIFGPEPFRSWNEESLKLR